MFLGINWEILILFWKHFTLNCLRVFLSILKVNQYIFFEFDNSFQDSWNADIYTKQKMHLTWVSVWMDLHNLYKMTWKPCRSMLNNIVDIFYHIGDWTQLNDILNIRILCILELFNLRNTLKLKVVKYKVGKV